MRLKLSVQIVCLSLVSWPPNADAAITPWAQWQVHSSKAFVLARQNDYEQSLSEYRAALDAARRENAEPQVAIDLQLDMVQDMVSAHRLPEAKMLLNQIGALEINKYRDSLLEVRYWHRVYLIAGAEGDSPGRLAAQKNVVRILGKHFASTSPVCLDQIHILQTLLCDAGEWNDLIPIARLYNDELRKNPTRLADDKCRLWLKELSGAVLVAAADDSGKYTSDMRLQLISMLATIDRDPHDFLDKMRVLAGVKDDRVKLQAQRSYLEAAKSVSDNLTAAEKSTLAGVSLQIMFWHLNRNEYNQEAEDCARTALEGLKAARPINIDIVIQAQTMYGLIVAKRGDLLRGQAIVDSLKLPDDAVKSSIRLGPFCNARSQIADEFVKRGDESGVRYQFAKMNELIESQRLLVVDPLLVKSLQWAEAQKIQQCRQQAGHH
ncbi:MAG TPA: hypothetical protein V6C69_17965 [Trichormus sp.]|jgi:hypothetical protein